MNRTIQLRSFLAVILPITLIAFCVASASQAGTISGPVSVPDIIVDLVGVGGEVVNLDIGEFELGDNKFKLKDASGEILLHGGSTSFYIEEFEFDPDPVVQNNYLITNNTGSTQSYSVTVNMATAFPAPNLISGSITTQVIDSTSNGATVAAPVGKSIYNALIDDATVATLQSDPFSVSATGGVNNSLASFGPIANGIAVTTDMGIRLDFTLTAGDSAAILSRFEVAAIPEPGTVALSSLAYCGLLVTRRR